MSETTEPNLLPDQPPIPRYILRPPERSRRGKGFLALSGTLLLNGAGHMMVGRVRRGMIWLAITVAMGLLGLLTLRFPPLVPGLIVIFPLSVALSLACLIDAYRCGRRASQNILFHPVLRYLAGIALIAMILLLKPGLLVAIPIRNHIADEFIMPTNSMRPTLTPKDRFLCQKQVPYSRGSLVVFRDPEQNEVYVKRLVGLPGETVEIVNSVVHINGQPIPSPPGITYTSYNGLNAPINGPGCEGHPITLKADEYYFLGDNSPISDDSRYWKALPDHQAGALPSNRIIGPVTWIYWPPSRWKRFQ